MPNGVKLADLETVKKAIFGEGYLPMLHGPPQAAMNILREMGWLGPEEEPGPFDNLVETSSMFTDITPKGGLVLGLVADDQLTPAPLCEIYEHMDLRGVVGQYTVNPIAYAKLGWDGGIKTDIREADDFISESRKKFTEGIVDQINLIKLYKQLKELTEPIPEIPSVIKIYKGRKQVGKMIASPGNVGYAPGLSISLGKGFGYCADDEEFEGIPYTKTSPKDWERLKKEPGFKEMYDL